MIYKISILNPDLRSFKLVHSPKNLVRLTQILIGIFLVCILLLTVLPWQQTSMGSGRVVAYSPTERQQSIDAPVEGRLGKWYVHEGSQVKAGDPIAEIVDNDPEILDRLETEKTALHSRLEAAKISIQTAKLNLDRQKILSEKGLSSKRAYELARLEYAKFQTEQANAQAELARIEVRLARQSSQSVKAPQDGTILRRISGEGSVLVKAGTSLAVIVPNTDSRAVELWMNGNDVSLLSEGQAVRLQFEGWPAIQFSGWPSVAVGTFGGRIAVVDAADNGNGKFRILIVPDTHPEEQLDEGLERPRNPVPRADRTHEPWPSGKYLRQGTRVHGWVLLGRVKLGYELWRQFNGFGPTLSSAPGSGSLDKHLDKGHSEKGHKD